MTTLTRLDCGDLHGDLALFETGAEGQVTLPVSAWLVRHPRGTVLFDTGMPVTFVEESDRVRRISEEVKIGFGANDTVEAQLQAASQDPGRWLPFPFYSGNAARRRHRRIQHRSSVIRAISAKATTTKTQ
jgi:hypothetical protein